MKVRKYSRHDLPSEFLWVELSLARNSKCIITIFTMKIFFIEYKNKPMFIVAFSYLLYAYCMLNVINVIYCMSEKEKHIYIYYIHLLLIYILSKNTLMRICRPYSDKSFSISRFFYISYVLSKKWNFFIWNVFL